MITRRVVAAALMLFTMPTGVWAMGKGKEAGPRQLPAGRNVAAALAAPARARKTMADQSVAPWRNHGQYVSCIVRYRNALRKAGCLDREAKRTIARCAARSTCGKVGGVVCCFDLPGTCNDPAPGNMLAEGVCSNDTEVACDTDADCTETRPKSPGTRRRAWRRVVGPPGPGVCARLARPRRPPRRARLDDRAVGDGTSRHQAPSGHSLQTRVQV
jgi:hypothetical protein